MNYQPTWNVFKSVAFLALGFAIAACTNQPIPYITAPADKAVEGEGKSYVMAMKKGQQAYFLEYGKLADTIEDLELGINSDTQSYRYVLDRTGEFEAHMTATAKSPGIKSYVASIFIIGEEESAQSISIVCESNVPSQTPPDLPSTPKTQNDLTCAEGSSQVN